MHSPAGSGTAQLPSHCCLGPNPGASGQALRTPPARVGPRASEKPGPRASESSVHGSQMEKPKASVPGTPQVLPPSSSPSPQQQEAPVGQETRARLLGGLGPGRRDEGPAFGDHRTWGPSTRHGRPGAGAYELGPGGEPPPRRGRARPSLCVSGVGSGRGLSQHQSSPGVGWGGSSGPDLAPWLGRHTGSRATTCDCVAGSGTAESPQPGVRGWGWGWGWARGGWVPPGSASA